jgi:hypothetical protein
MKNLYRTIAELICVITLYLINLQGMGCYGLSSTREGVTKMANIQLTLSLYKTDYMSGESIVLGVTITNNGNEVVSLQATPEWSVQYELLSPDERKVIYKISSNDLPWRTDPDAPVLELEFDEIPPGESISYEEDIASYVSGAICAGEYNLVAQGKINDELFKSEPAKIVIHPSQYRFFNTEYCTYSGSFVSILEHQDIDKKFYGYLRESMTILADYGVFYRYTACEKLQDIGFSVYADSRIRGRWAAHIQNGTFNASLTDEGDLLGRSSEISLELTQPQLVKPGFQMIPAGNDRFGPALFMVKGLHNNQAVIQPYTVSIDCTKKGERIQLGTTLPEKIIAGFSTSRQGREIVLAWPEKNGTGFRIVTRTLSKEGLPVASEPVTVLKKDVPLLAMELAPISTDQEHWIHALYGPVRVEEVKTDDQVKKIVVLAYCRIPLNGTGQAIQEYPVQAPEGSYEKPVELLAISGYTTGGLHIIAKHNEDILHASAKKFTGWSVLFSGLSQTSNLHLAADMSNYWCAIWFDPERGIMYGPNPDFDMNQP